MTDSVLIIQPGFLGDAVLATGMIRALATVSPTTSVGFLVRKEFGSLFNGHPAIDSLHLLDKKKKGELRRISEELRSKKYGASFIPHRALRSVLIPFRAGIRRRIGFRQSDLRLLLSMTVEYNIAKREIDRNAMLVAQLFSDIPSEHRNGWLVPDATEYALAQNSYGEGGPIVVVAPGSVWETKRWPSAKFAAVANGLHDAGWHVLLVGSAQEKDLCERVAMDAGLSGEHVLAGTLSLAGLVALIAVARRVISNDSAPLHIAESVGTPVTALFGPTVPEFGFAPYLPDSVTLEKGGLSCRPCGIHGHRSCPIGTHECMERIAVEDVLATVVAGD